MLDIIQIPCLEDNFIYLIRDEATGTTAVVDPAEAAPVLKVLRQKNWKLHFILNTHHHGDHVGGNLDLRAETGCEIIGHGKDASRITGITRHVNDGDTVAVGNSKALVIAVDGHTVGHIAYWFRDSGALFCGDTIFGMGCGRLFEGTPQQMWSSLSRLKDLPRDTKIYCAHEYTMSNGRFAITVEPQNPDVIARVERVRQARERGQWTVPLTLEEELLTNPFLRADQKALQEAIGLVGKPADHVFAYVRRQKDNF